MAYGIEMRFDAGFTATIREAWDQLEQAGIPSMKSYTHRNHVPHLTMLIVDHLFWGDVEVIQDITRVDRYVTFDSLGLFPQSPVLFLAATPSPDLIMVHMGLNTALEHRGAGIWPNYATSAWIPHCTLALDIPATSLSEAIAISSSILPSRARIETYAITDEAGSSMLEWTASS